MHPILICLLAEDFTFVSTAKPELLWKKPQTATYSASGPISKALGWVLLIVMLSCPEQPLLWNRDVLTVTASVAQLNTLMLNPPLQRFAWRQFQPPKENQGFNLFHHPLWGCRWSTPSRFALLRVKKKDRDILDWVHWKMTKMISWFK